MCVGGDVGVIVPHSRPFLDQDDIAAVSEVLSSGRIAQGEKVREFEEGIARFVGAKYGVASSSGTSALHLALLGLGVGSGDEVVIPSYVCSSPYFATLHAGALPKIADINLVDFNLSAESARKQLTAKTKAIIVPHMFGTPAELDELLELEVPIIEDCAQSLGSEYRGKQVGGFGVLSTFSFYATKMITSGEGGMVLTNNREFYDRVVEFRDYDKKLLYPAKYNYKMTDFQAALGLSQLKKLRYFIERRTQIAVDYDKAFSKYRVELPTSSSHKKSVHFRYVIKTSGTARIQQKARERGVTCEKPVFQPLHDSLGLKNFHNCDKAKQEALSIPIYPSLLESEIDHIIKTVGEILPREH
jgi:dTDP-4-amino-4,6-dideoxygalactose transaminase